MDAQPIRLIVPFAPGGASDFAARIIAQALSDELKQSILVENKGGAAGDIAMEAAAKAASDGYTRYFGNAGTITVNPSMFGAALKVKPEQDFVAVTMLGEVPMALVQNPAVPATTLNEFIAYAKDQKGTLNYGSPGIGSQARLQMEILMREAQIKLVQVPCKGGAGAAMTDLLGGHVQAIFTSIPSAIDFIQSGQVRALAVTTQSRIPQRPSVPTFTEQGYAEQDNPPTLHSTFQGDGPTICEEEIGVRGRDCDNQQLARGVQRLRETRKSAVVHGKPGRQHNPGVKRAMLLTTRDKNQ